MNNRRRHLPILGAVLLLQGYSQADINLAPTSEMASGPILATSAPATSVEPLPSPAAVPPEAALPPHTANYTVIKGDTLTSLSNKFNTTRKKLKSLNNLADSKLTPGQVILVPSYKKKAAVVAEKAKLHHTYAQAQPVQDFDVPASTFASCPVPEPNDDAETPAANPEPAATVTTTTTSRIAQLVSPNELVADQATRKKVAALDLAKQQAAQKTAVDQAVAVASTQTAPITKPAPTSMTTFTAKNVPGSTTSKFAPSGLANTSNTSAPSTTKSNGLLAFFRMHPTISTPSNDWANRFLTESRALGAQGIGYDQAWRPPGEARSWDMDCSNTSRYLYKITTGINLPRTASDQYYYLHLQGKAWDVPTNKFGWADGEYLKDHLKPGDLLFWENTYRPERTPPITHVMVFLGTNAQGQWIMAGSQSGHGGERNRRNGGPDIYLFHPAQACGGYTTWLGMVRHKGRFCAYGRPLEADPSKFALQ